MQLKAGDAAASAWTATAIFGGGPAPTSLWLFWVAPILGGVIGGIISRWLQED